MIFKKNILIIFYVTGVFWQFQLVAQTDSLYTNKSEWEAFPIINYDSDAGFGYGGKGFLFNYLEGKESFDLTLYNSTKGEQWYRFVFSITDLQRRQGKKYPIAFDLIADYDKWIKYKYYTSFYNFLTAEHKEETLTYERETFELTALLSRGFVKDFVAELGIRFKSINSFGLDPVKHNVYMNNITSKVKVASLIFNFRLDTRKNFINPQDGFVLEIDNEIARDIIKPPAQNFYKIGVISQSYIKLFVPNLVFANRVVLQAISDVGYQLLLPLGGNNTLRGLPQDRYLSNSAILINSELRFPIIWRLGGIAGVDIGNSESTPDWIINPVAGLRFYMNNFVVRLDIGFGKETTGVYFNFGHIF
jgi:outer membrane protein assembly factor BamA